MNMRAAKQQGFSLVEILIVIVVIAILASILFVSINGLNRRAAEVTVLSDLSNARKQMELLLTLDGAYPTTLPASIKTSPKVAFTLSNAQALPHYGSLSPVQNGVLLSQICQDLINEGRGQGTNLGGGTESYIMNCGNWNSGSMQVTAWNTRVFSTPIDSDTFSNYAATVPSGGAWHPDQQSITQNFYLELKSRLIAQGGAFPITTFWDAWATPTNGGVMRQDLPAPDSLGAGSSYCIQASYNNDPALTWHVRQSGVITQYNC